MRLRHALPFVFTCACSPAPFDIAPADAVADEVGDAIGDATDSRVEPPSCTGAATEPCGKCGKRTRVCVSPETWGEWSACTGEGVCAPGAFESVAGGCPGALEKKSRTCSSSCAWAPDVCAMPKGWSPIATAPSGFESRLGHSAVWTGGELIIFGGGKQFDAGDAARRDGAIYSLAKNAWELIPPAIAARRSHAAAWTGAQLYVYGGMDGSTLLADCVAYDAVKKTWIDAPAAPLAGRMLSGAVWIPTVKKLFIWGGTTDGTKALADGALLARTMPDTWTKLPAAPIAARFDPVVLWTGKEVLVFGGKGVDGGLVDGALYDPVANTWRALPAAPVPAREPPMAAGLTTTGDFVFFGGIAGTSPVWSGARVTLGASPVWSVVSSPDAAALLPRVAFQAWVANDTLAVWSGAKEKTDAFEFVASGGALDLSKNAWGPLATTGAPSVRGLATTVWTGKGALVWGGLARPGGGVPELVTDGAIYVP
ncbi:MAG: hypothetical protein HYV09_11225 [Deltaproteobacteria bacterium]|nr:hypothetical protein [Deltaproteobacteria bacterium]